MYHASLNCHDNDIFTPRIPKNYFTNHGYEDNKTPRVSFSETIDGALIGIHKNIVGCEMFIHKPKNINNIKILNNKEIVNRKLVPDSHITKELWVLEPIKLEITCKIKIIGVDETPLEFTYGCHKAKCFKFLWEYI